MRATVMYGAGDVRIENVPDARLIDSTDALMRVTRAGIYGSDLLAGKSMEPSETGRRMGHEFIGVVEAVGDDVRTIKAGELVVSPFLWSDGTCVFCRRGLHTRASTEEMVALTMSTEAKARRCVFLRPTEPSLSCRSVQTSP